MATIFLQISISEKKKKKKKNVISDVVLCALCMWVLYGGLQVIQAVSQLFSTLHCSWCVSEYKSGPSCSKHRKLNELVSGQNVNCSSKYNI